jgi:hypothetical protein
MKAALRGTNRKEIKQRFGYIELHHIIPKSFNLVDKNIKTNQVFLTAKEHFICHRLLVKMVTGTRIGQMWLALFSMCMIGKHTRKMISARQYEYIKINTFDQTYSAKMSAFASGKFTGMSYFNNGKITVRTKECPEGFKAGRITNQPRNWFTDGKINRMAFECPDGFRSGRTNKSTKGMKWFTDGNENICGFECPKNWWPGQTKNISRKGFKSWTNGIENIYTDSCPEGFWHGQAKKPKHKKIWVNNGIKNIRRTICPPGFMIGKIDFGRPTPKNP